MEDKPTLEYERKYDCWTFQDSWHTEDQRLYAFFLRIRQVAGREIIEASLGCDELEGTKDGEILILDVVGEPYRPALTYQQVRDKGFKDPEQWIKDCVLRWKAIRGLVKLCPSE